MDEQLVEDFRESLEDFQQDHTGHDFVVDENTVTFFGDWEASHEAWLFKQFLDDEGYTTTWGRTRHDNKDPKSVVVAEDVDVPDWVRAKLAGREEVVLMAMDERVQVHRDELDEGVEELKKELWRSIQSVSGVGKSTVEKIAEKFETPMDAMGEWESVDGVGSSTADSLESFMEVWS
jgi:hypothetical protein